MFNDRLTSEEAKERVKERMREAETYSMQKRLGYGEYGAARWVFVLLLVMIALAIGILL